MRRETETWIAKEVRTWIFVLFLEELSLRMKSDTHPSRNLQHIP